MQIHDVLTLTVASVCALFLTNGIAAFRTVLNSTDDEQRKKIKIGQLDMTMRRYMAGEGVGYILTSALSIMGWLMYITG
ncbi:hypothetical protein F3J38_03915 [Pantoea sp. Acro-805]|uniref:Uncharacterized protein n=1 Tax=Candidatus Pantoea formicae TaxID=2608355 RepID=A0ABX0QR31_9GAMM|nr:hypothetical protein [Pantoea formicae]MDF7649520.1 hypothetical protein [Erwiniaceae bacterium L1_54_3]NIE99224.1 hypothetical protein [Pantoea formicae]